jgi:DNA-binding PadR family transcriptional regulator
MPSGTLYPILARLRAAGWVHADWEQPEPDASRPARRYYRLTRRALSRLATASRSCTRNSASRPEGAGAAWRCVRARGQARHECRKARGVVGVLLRAAVRRWPPA